MGYTSTWRLFVVDRQTWADAYELAGFMSATVSRETGGLIESGSIDLDHREDIGEQYVRLVMVASDNGTNDRIDVATFLCTTSGGNWDGATFTITGNSVLRPADTAIYDDGAFCGANVDAAQWATRELQKVLHAPVTCDGSFELAEPMVFDLGASVLESVWAVLDAGNFTIMTDGYGNVAIAPMPDTPLLSIDMSNSRLLMQGGSTARDWSEVPNRYIARDGANVAIALNDSIDSQVSTVSRGYRVDHLDTEPAPIGGETLQGYADRRLVELSTVPVEITYTREWHDGINPCSIVSLSIGEQGEYRVVSQSYTCGNGITVTEKARKEVVLWTT